MNRNLALLCLAMALSAGAAYAANSVVIQSRVAPASDTAVSVGVYLQNDVDLGAVALPFVIREVSSGSFIAGSLDLESTNRLSDHLTGFVVTSYLPTYRDEDPWECRTGGFETRGEPDFISPDALLHVALIGDSESCLPAGNDGSPPGGTPSLVISFGVTSAIGSFAIDTTCVTPANHLLFMDCEIPAGEIIPAFTKGVIEIGGPFWHADSISGHIHSNLAIIGDVVVSGDLTVDSGVTLTLASGSHLSAAAFTDDQASGVDTSRVEIIVDGTLAIEPTGSTRPVLSATEDTTGAWYGIRVVPDGRFQTGIGASIEHAVVGLTIEGALTTDTLVALSVGDCSSTGIRIGHGAGVLMNDTIFDATAGYGIYVDSADPVIEHCLVSNCEYGIHTFLSSALVTDTRITGPGTYGIYVASGSLYGDIDTLRLVHDSVLGYFSVAHLSVGAIDLCRVDSCGFISDLGGQRSPYGVKAGFGGRVRMRHSTVKHFTTTDFDSNRSGSHLGRAKAENGGVGDDGYNDIEADTTGCGSCALKRLAHVGTDTLRADGNWWGASPPQVSWFSGKVDYTPWLTSPPAGKMAVPEKVTRSAEVPETFSVRSYPNPFNAAATIEFALPTAQRVQISVFNILGQLVRDLVDQEFPAGRHRVTWDGKDMHGGHLASGLYLYRIAAEDMVETRKMVLLK